MKSLFLKSQLPTDFLEQLKVNSKQRNFSPKEIIVFQGEYADELLMIDKGLAKYTICSPEGEVQTIYYCGHGTFVNEDCYMCKGNKSKGNLEAVTELSLLAFPQNARNELYNITGFKKILLNSIALKTCVTQRQIESISFQDAEKRIRSVLADANKSLEDFALNEKKQIHFTQKDIAELCGCSLKTVNRFVNKNQNINTS